jgi:hypothetical protein
MDTRTLDAPSAPPRALRAPADCAPRRAAPVDKLVIEGGRRLEGEIPVSGAKNAALPILCAALLAPEPLELTHVPRLNDVRTMRTLLSQMGVRIEERAPGEVVLDASRIEWPLAPGRHVVELWDGARLIDRVRFEVRPGIGPGPAPAGPRRGQAGVPPRPSSRSMAASITTPQTL